MSRDDWYGYYKTAVVGAVAALVLTSSMALAKPDIKGEALGMAASQAEILTQVRQQGMPFLILDCKDGSIKHLYLTPMDKNKIDGILQDYLNLPTKK